MVKRVLQKDADRRVKRVVKARLPFHPNVEKPRAFSMRDRQKAWIISGLRHLKAPMVSWHALDGGTKAFQQRN